MLTGAVSLGLWGMMTGSLQENKRKKIITVPLDNSQTVLFREDCIVINSEHPVVFSSYCTHLGCRIRTLEDGKLICPCHGSVFGLDGIPEKGPAVRPLEKLKFSINKNTNVMTINI